MSYFSPVLKAESVRYIAEPQYCTAQKHYTKYKVSRLCFIYIFIDIVWISFMALPAMSVSCEDIPDIEPVL